MRTLLVNPPSKFLIDDNVFPTLGLLYIGAYLKVADYGDVSVLDLNGMHTMPEIIDADIVGFYSNTPQFPSVLKLKETLKSANINKSAAYVIGGPHVSSRPVDAESYFDYVVMGEGERAFLDIIKGVDTGKRLPEKVIKYNYIKDLDSIPFPDRDLVDLKSYRYLINGDLATTLITSRGCPYGCAFCANNAWGKTLRLRSPQNIIDELRILIDKYDYRTFMFFDDTMTVHRKRMEILCEMLKKLNITYRCFIRADTVDKDILAKMKESGCVEVGMGMESGSQRILNIVNKGQTVVQNMRAVKWCKEVGLSIKGFFVVGFPGEDAESVRETIDFIGKSRVDDLDITMFTPYPGSKIYQEKDKYDIRFKGTYEDSWYKGKPGSYRSSVSTSSLSSEKIANIRDEIEKRFKKKSKLENKIYAGKENR